MSQPTFDSDAILRAMEENLWALWSRFGKGDGCTLHDGEGALWFETPLPLLPYNGVLRFSQRADVDQAIDHIFRTFRQRQVPFMWLLHPTAAPPDLDQRLVARGFQQAETLHGMWMDLEKFSGEDAQPEGFEIREMRAEKDFDGLMELVAWRWEVPSALQAQLLKFRNPFELGVTGRTLRCWIAWRGSEPVAKLILNCDCGAAGVYAVATKPSARGSGLGRALTMRALTTARKEGSSCFHSITLIRSVPCAMMCIVSSTRSIRLIIVSVPTW